MVREVNNMGRWTAAGLITVFSLIWLWLELAASSHPVLMLCLWGAAIAAAFLAGKMYDRAISLSLRDDLTTAFNRRFVVKVMPSLLAKAARKQASLSVTVIDCDDFKKINDENGHHAGDTVLRAIAGVLVDNTRSRRDDYLVRWGGDEFLLIASGTDSDSTKMMLERLRRELILMSKMMNMPLSVSTGTAIFPEDGASIEDLIQMADQRMYQWKRQNKAAASEASGAAVKRNGAGIADGKIRTS